jgi:very-short-patch-repair endonuclease
MPLLKKKAANYKGLDDKAKYDFLYDAHFIQGMTWAAIGDLCGEYGNTIRRHALKLKVPIRTRSEAQKKALADGTKQHPTKGKHRSEEVKYKISEKVSASWAALSDEELERRKQIGKDHWDSMSVEEKTEMSAKAGDAVRVAAKEGSKLERFLFGKLVEHGFRPQFHVERTIKNENLQIDIVLPHDKVAIEVDGPSHFLPIWGADMLAKNQRSDQVKNGLLLGAGLCVIRLRHSRGLTEKYKRDLWKELHDKLVEIQAKFPEREHRYIILGDKDE